MKSICVFCGSNFGDKPDYELGAIALGQLLARRGITLVYGGGKVIGVIPEFLRLKELDHPGLSELHVVASMHERKAMMAELSDGFIAMPGGYGTYEELLEVLSWSQLGMHHKPVGLLDVAGFYTPFLTMMRHTVEQGFAREQNLDLMVSAATPDALLARRAGWAPVAGSKWLDKRAI